MSIPFMLLAFLAKRITGVDTFIHVQMPCFPPLITVMPKWKTSHQEAENCANAHLNWPTYVHWAERWSRVHLNLWTGHCRAGRVPELSSSITLPSLRSPRASTTLATCDILQPHLRGAGRASESCSAGVGGIYWRHSHSGCFSLSGASLGGNKHASRTSRRSTPGCRL